jgi:DNA-binding transcriptional LysR family regulator
LNISLLTTFALGWLVPRLPLFQSAHPSIDVRLTTTARLIDFAVEDVDVAIRYGTGGWPGLRCDRIIDDVITPLCNARFKEKLRKPADIFTVPLLHEQYEHDWRTWFRAAGLSVGQLKKGPIFDSTRVAIEAAIAGVGVACGAPSLFSAEIATGQLHQPFDLVVPNGKSYWLVSPEATAERPKIRALREWMLEEAAKPAPEPPRADIRSGRAAAAPRKSATASRAPGRDGASRG